jgi:hypothetical protein
MSNPDAIANVIAFMPRHPAVPVLSAIQDRWGETHFECRFQEKPLCLVSVTLGFYTGVSESWLDFFDTVVEMDNYIAESLVPGYWPVAAINMSDGTGRQIVPRWHTGDDVDLLQVNVP